MGCGNSHSKSFKSLDVKGLTEMKTSPTKAITYFTQALQHKLENMELYKESIGKSYLVISYTYFEGQKDYIKAINPAIQALQYLETFSKKNLVLAYALLTLSNLEKEQLDPAKFNLEKLLAITKEIFAEGSEDSLIGMNVKANYDRKSGKYSEALIGYLAIFQIMEKMPVQSKDEVRMNKIQNSNLDDEKEPLNLGITLLELSLVSDISEICYFIAECYINLKDVDNGCLYLKKYFGYVKDMHSEGSYYNTRVKRVIEKAEKLKGVLPGAGEKIDNEIEIFEKDNLSLSPQKSSGF